MQTFYTNSHWNFFNFQFFIKFLFNDSLSNNKLPNILSSSIALNLEIYIPMQLTMTVENVTKKHLKHPI